MSKKIVIVSGGELEKEFVFSVLEKMMPDYVIGVDKGMEFLYHHVEVFYILLFLAVT